MIYIYYTGDGGNGGRGGGGGGFSAAVFVSCCYSSGRLAVSYTEDGHRSRLLGHGYKVFEHAERSYIKFLIRFCPRN